ncbi:MAG: LysM domain-containing protein [Pseudomonadota bacterium]
MKVLKMLMLAALVIGPLSACTYFQKKDEPPPLPVIEETKPPLTLNGEYFNAFPWDKLAKPQKNGNDPDTFTYAVKEGDSLENVAEKNMGDSGLSSGLAAFNDLSPSSDLKSGEKIVVPYPIIGVRSRMLVKAKGAKQFGDPEPFDTELKKGDEYKLSFESNIAGYCYILRESTKGIEFLYPAVAKPIPAVTKKKGKKPAPEPEPGPESEPVKPRVPIVIPAGPKGFGYDPKLAADKIHVFLSVRRIPELDDLKEKKKVTRVELDDVLHRVKEGEVYREAPYTLLRISDPKEILGFSLNLSG